MKIPEEFLEGLEMVLLEEIEFLKQNAENGVYPSPLDIANGYLSPDHSGGKLSHRDHVMALACMVGISLHWLACREDEAASQ
jgi:hypothetical protein